MLSLTEIRDDIVKKREELVIYYNPCEKHFEVGDLAYIVDGYGEVVEVRITDICDYRKKNDDGGLVYYWFEYKNIPVYKRLYQEIKFQICLLLKIKYDIPYYFGPGHSELVGRGEVLFKSKEQALLDDSFNVMLICLDDIEDYCKKLKQLEEFNEEYHLGE